MRTYSLILLIIMTGLISCSRPSKEKPGPAPPDFPFIMENEKASVIFIEPEYYNQKNIHRLFLWHYKKGLNTRNASTIMLFTDKRLLDAYHIASLKKYTDWSYREPLPIGSNPSPSPSPWYSSRLHYYDANYFIVPSESSIDPNKGEDRSSRGYNVEYSFAPDLIKPNEIKKVVLRGATWREGKYNIETHEFPWAPGKITLEAYDIYNVEPKGRYYTFTVPRMIGDYRSTSIVFNILPDKPVEFNRKLVQIFNDRIAYVYLGWMYSVTLDGGRTWHLWDGERKLPEWECCDPGLIQEVSISDQGTGIMTLRPDPKKPESLIRLKTSDFGQHWAQ